MYILIILLVTVSPHRDIVIIYNVFIYGVVCVCYTRPVRRHRRRKSFTLYTYTTSFFKYRRASLCISAHTPHSIYNNNNNNNKSVILLNRLDVTHVSWGCCRVILINYVYDIITFITYCTNYSGGVSAIIPDNSFCPLIPSRDIVGGI